ncbi:MAG: CoA-binding protein, partial [Ekhidna sp.]|nr:CoA-binding protein [Ekhidna sp.]
MSKKTAILGATTNQGRYAYFAAERLAMHNHPFVPIGIKKGAVLGEEILDLRGKPKVDDIHTVTMYIGP